MKNQHEIQKTERLRSIFIRYLLTFCLETFFWAAFSLILFNTLLSYGVILPANAAEKQIEAAREAMATREPFTRDLVPDLCQFALYTPQGEMISGNLSPVDAKKGWELTQTSESGHDSFYIYLRIPRKNEVCVVRYTILAQFSSPVLRSFFPNVEFLGLFIVGAGFLLGLYLLATSFGKELTRKLVGLKNATEKIQNQDLDFSVESSGVAEFDQLLHSIDQMKEALKASLQRQWDLEQTRREQISALAHDVKTPLTIVRGNVDLLRETSLSTEQREYADYIALSVQQMEQYIKTLIQISKAEIETNFCKREINSRAFLEEICNQIQAMAAVKKLKLDNSERDLPETFNADPDLLLRAIMNVALNATEYSPEQGEIRFTAEAAGGCICFCIADSGQGFSTEALKQATQQFYMGDHSRASKTHYGLGLFIADSIVRLHKGRLQIANSTATGGGQVTIEIPID